jgi:predicted nuclease with TOPRIM domain
MEEKNFMERFKKNFSRMLKKGISASNSDESVDPDNNNSEKLMQSEKRHLESLDELKDRMTKLEIMFARIFEKVDNICNDVKNIKENQDSLHSLSGGSNNVSSLSLK